MKNENSKKEAEAGERAHKYVDTIYDKAGDIKDKYNEKMTQLKGKLTQTKHGVDGHIKNNPETSVLIAAGAGMLAGAIITALIMRRR